MEKGLTQTFSCPCWAAFSQSPLAYPACSATEILQATALCACGNHKTLLALARRHSRNSPRRAVGLFQVPITATKPCQTEPVSNDCFCTPVSAKDAERKERFGVKGRP